MELNLFQIFLLMIGIFVSLAFVAYFLLHWGFRFPIIPIGIRKRLRGTWQGEFVQTNELMGKPISGTMLMKLDPGLVKIRSEIYARSNFLNVSHILRIKGGVRGERFLLMEYFNPRLEVNQFGTVLLELSANGRRLAGRMIGFGPESEEIVVVDVFFVKIDFKLNEKTYSSLKS